MPNITLQSIPVVLAKNCPTLKLAATIDEILAGTSGVASRQGGGHSKIEQFAGVA
jgi:hypothetical protein